MQVTVTGAGLTPDDRPRKFIYLAYTAMVLRDLGHEVYLDAGAALVDQQNDIIPPGAESLLMTPGPGLWEADAIICDAKAIFYKQIFKAKYEGDVKVVAIGRAPFDLSDEAVRYDLYLSAHHPAEEVGGQNVLVSHLPHPKVLSAIEERGLLDAYLRDDLDAIREGMSYPIRGPGFVGSSAGRKHVATLLSPMVQWRWNVKLDPWEYLEWLSGCKAVVDIPGQNIQCHRFAEAVLVGRPIIAARNDLHELLFPIVDSSNAILLDGWGDRVRFFDGMAVAQERAKKADEDYKRGWSLRAQMKQMIERLNMPIAIAEGSTEPETEKPKRRAKK